MKLCLLNTSKQAKKSQLRKYLQYFLKGYTLVCSTNFDLIYQSNYNQAFSDIIKDTENLILAFEIENINDLILIEKYVEQLSIQFPEASDLSLSFFILNKGDQQINRKNAEPQIQYLVEKTNHFYNGMIVIEENSNTLFSKQTFKKIEQSGMHFAKTTELKWVNPRFFH